MIYTEMDKSEVVFSSLFVRHYPKLYNQLSAILMPYLRGYGTVSNTKDYWVRDFMPIQMGEGTFVKFVFNPDYLQDKKKYITNVSKVVNHSPITSGFEMVNVPLVIDGGNMVFCKGHMKSFFLAMTEKTLVENPNFSKQQIEALLRCAFRETQLTIVWLPWDKEDTFGHTDGIVRYMGVNEKGKPIVLVNLELYAEKIAEKMYDALAEYFDVVELKLSRYDELSWAYINCLQTMNYTIIPGIGNPQTDAEALEQYKQMLPQYTGNIYQVQMRDFIAEQGGALNCLTWTYYEGKLNALKRVLEPPEFNQEDRIYWQCQEQIDELIKGMYLK